MKKKRILFAVLALSLLTVIACTSKEASGTMPMTDGKSPETMEDKGKSEGDMMEKSMEPMMEKDMDVMPEENANSMMTETQSTQKESLSDFEMTDLDGNVVRLSSFAGEKVYIKFWASWCPICLGGLQDINVLSAGDNGFKVLTVVAPGQKGEKNVKDFKTWFAGVENTEYITVLFDTDGKYGSRMGVRGYPTSEYIGSDGVPVKVVPGHVDNDTVKAVFETIS